MTQDNRDSSRPYPAWADDIESLMADPEALEHGRVTLEFPDNSTPLSVSRREFLRVASVAAAGAGAAAACSYPEDHVVPYVRRPAGVYHDTPGDYTTVCKGCSAGCGMLMSVREGRLTKVEGNPKHPVSRGALCARGQATVYDLFSPDRTRAPQKIEGGAATETTWETLDKAVGDALRGARKVRLLTTGVSGPAELALIDAFLGLFEDGKHIVWEPLAPTGARKAQQTIYGEQALPVVRFDRAQSVVSFGADFLGTWRSQVEHTKGWAATRDPDRKAGMSRLTVFEPMLSVTGGAADVRVATRPSDLVHAALAVANELIVAGRMGRFATDSAVTSALAPFSADKVAQQLGCDAALIKSAAADLKTAGRRGLAVGNDNDAALGAVVALINESLANGGTTVDGLRSYQSGLDVDPDLKTTRTQGGFAAMTALMAELPSVDVLIIADANPLYDAPAAMKVAESLGKAKMRVYVGDVLNETAHSCEWFAARTHFFEQWGDSHPMSQVFALQQPGLMPLESSRALQDSLIGWAAVSGKAKEGPIVAATKASAEYKDTLNRPTPGPWYYFLHQHWKLTLAANVRSPFGDGEFWDSVLREGVYVVPGPAPRPPSFDSGKAVGLLPKKLDPPKGDELQLFETVAMGDGRFAHNGLLHELPDPMSQVSWGSWVAIGPTRFTQMNLKNGDIVEVKTESGSIKAPALIQPGLPADVVAIPVGYGRTKAGVVGSDLGANAYTLAAGGPEGAALLGAGVSVTATGEFEMLGMPEGKGHVIDTRRRHLVPFTTLEEYRADPKSGAEYHEDPDLWPDHEYPDTKWGMAIDLSRCTGCSACTIACYVENNVPVVGKTGIIEGRSMTWLRIDRYYALPPDKESYTDELLTTAPEVAAAEYLENPDVLIQPMLCQHCTNAPCETVCPVLATVHSDDGLNEQIYNRCVGTRYCANNCPYKVRRFNWFSYSTDRSDEFFADVFPELKEHNHLNVQWPLPLRFNPEVTVRARGVMEKCSFCVQRIRKGTTVYRRLGIDEPVQTACQQSCPADAITFGNLRDDSHEVSKKDKSPRAFRVISHLNTQPAVKYLTRVRNA